MLLQTPTKLLVWICFSEEGISKQYFCPRNLSVTGKIYRKDCIKARLVPFLKRYHSGNDYYFWPDLTSAHYAADTISFFEESGIKNIPKSANPPNCPQLRPIEDLGAILKASIYEGGWLAFTLLLKQRVKKKLQETDISICQVSKLRSEIVLMEV